jgi:hypothetical protein
VLRNVSKTCCTLRAVRGPGHGVWQHTVRIYQTLFEAFTYDAAGA